MTVNVLSEDSQTFTDVVLDLNGDSLTQSFGTGICGPYNT